MDYVTMKKERIRRKSLAQDRLDRIRRDQKFKRKMRETLEKFGDQQSDAAKGESTRSSVLLDKFSSDPKQVELCGRKQLQESGYLARKKYHKPASKSYQGYLKYRHLNEEVSGGPHPSTVQIVSSDFTRGAGACEKTKYSYGILSDDIDHCTRSSNRRVYNSRNSESKIHSSEEEKCRKRNGIAAQRLENIRKGAKISSSEPTCKPNLRKKNASLQKSNQRCKNSDESDEKSMIENSRENRHTQPNSNVMLKETIAKEPVFAELEAGASVNKFTNCDGVLYEKYCMDVDMDDPRLLTDVDSGIENSKANLSDKWLEERNSKISFFVDEIERLRKDPAYLARHEDYIQDVEMHLLVPSGDLLIVVDTNIFLSHLRFLNRLSRSNIATYKSHVLIVPWVVIQEIDYAMKKQNRQLVNQAKLANDFIFECFKKENSKFFGQSFEDFKINFKNAVSVDDFLLQYCLKLIALKNNVILLSNDKNLISKCMFSHVAAYTKENFERTFDIHDSR